MVQQITRHKIEVVVWELRVLGHALREIDTNTKPDSTHMTVAQHRCATIDAPHFGIGEALLQRDGQLTDAAAHVEDATHLAVLGQRQPLRSAEVCLVLIVRAVRGAGVKTVGAVVVHMAGERVAHVPARLDMNLMAGVDGNIELRRELEHARPRLVRRFHLGEISVFVLVKMQL